MENILRDRSVDFKGLYLTEKDIVTTNITMNDEDITLNHFKVETQILEEAELIIYQRHPYAKPIILKNRFGRE